MSGLRLEPRPVPVRRYRYSKLRWRVLVHALDFFGAVLMAIVRRLRPAPIVTDPRSILIVQLDHMGDAVLTSPILPRLRAAYPRARIDVLASPSNCAIFNADRQVDRVIVAEKNWFERGAARRALGSAVWRLGLALRRERYDLGIDVRGDVLTVFVMALAGVKRRVGWAMGGGGFLLTDVAKWVPGRHEVRSRMALLECLGVPENESPRVRVGVTDDDRSRIAELLQHSWPGRNRGRSSRVLVSGGRAVGSRSRPRSGRTIDADRVHAGRFGENAPLLAIHMGAGTAAKRWPEVYWHKLIEKFLNDGWRIVIVGGREDIGLSSRLTEHASLCDWTGLLAVTETAALLERADLFLGSDSGPAHLAACAGVPSVILFSGTNLVRQWRPWSRRSLVLRQRARCRPCHHKTCPLADHPCLTGLKPERVYRMARAWWARLHGGEAPHAPL